MSKLPSVSGFSLTLLTKIRPGLLQKQGSENKEPAEYALLQASLIFMDS